MRNRARGHGNGAAQGAETSPRLSDLFLGYFFIFVGMEVLILSSAPSASPDPAAEPSPSRVSAGRRRTLGRLRRQRRCRRVPPSSNSLSGAAVSLFLTGDPSGEDQRRQDCRSPLEPSRTEVSPTHTAAEAAPFLG